MLSNHADQLNRGEAASIDAHAAPERRSELVSLMHTATRIKRLLAPVRMAPAFRARLRDGLALAARHKESQSALIGRRNPAWGWVIGVAALSSAAGLMALAWRARHAPRAMDVIAPESKGELSLEA
jgi:hypothetical protein